MSPAPTDAAKVLDWAHGAAKHWAAEYWDWMRDKDLLNIHNLDRVKPETRRMLLAILEEGMDNITAEKLRRLGLDEVPKSSEVAEPSGGNER